MTNEEFEEMLLRHEGLRLQPYKDSEGYLTIGVGRLIDPEKDGGITHDEAIYLMRNDIDRKAAELGERFPIVHDMDSTRYYILVNMAFNLGISGLAGFKKMWRAIHERDYQKAAEEMLDSKWATQVGKRAQELALLMKFGGK